MFDSLLFDRPVTVVGGGPAGAASALFLARLGARVTILERVVEPTAVGAALAREPRIDVISGAEVVQADGRGTVHYRHGGEEPAIEAHLVVELSTARTIQGGLSAFDQRRRSAVSRDRLLRIATGLSGNKRYRALMQEHPVTLARTLSDGPWFHQAAATWA